jgi:hypothetical protein
MAVKGSGKPGVEFLLTSQSHFNTFNRENMTFNNQEHPLAPLGVQYTLLTSRYELTLAAIPSAGPLLELFMAQGRLLSPLPPVTSCRDYFLSEFKRLPMSY